MQVVVPRTYFEYTSRRVMTTEWLEGEKLSQSKVRTVVSAVMSSPISNCVLSNSLMTSFGYN